ncbi:hypothetical protein H2198_007975 [Neophaeococcomyces mojaviensis]|uniref:Uncharacterized protein n=1 Tax=Neophaeococcomyces mojaviensis TaxID=3383035 RepID=A0ACC2ZYM9_9EURO|nr:hypothetical protein H2198_007975 [Knufia sp. JES_112]
MPGKAIEELREEFALKNLERLSQFPPQQPPPEELSKPCSPGLKLLQKWSNDNKDVIQAAIKATVLGKDKSQISWDIAFLPFMESTAVYLRDWGLFAQALETYRKHRSHGSLSEPQIREVVSLYNNSTLQIQTLAELWGLDFMVICDLVDLTPEGHLTWDGPYLGGFFTTAAQGDNQFIGLAFKGTNPFNWKEVQVDYNYQLQHAEGYLENQQVSLGVYTGLFGKFPEPYGIAYDFLIGAVDLLASRLSSKAVMTHVTGHSLGGSYSTMCYIQLLISSLGLQPPKHLNIGDEYTFGAPRVGDKEWATIYQGLIEHAAGTSWRIVNDNDIVPQVAPTELKPEQLSFCHVNTGMQIFPNKAPIVIPSEIPGPYPPPYPIDDWKDLLKAILDIGAHLPNFYYESLEYALQHPSA